MRESTTANNRGTPRRATAAVFTGPNSPLVIEHLELAPPSEGEVCVKLVASGLCHSDLHVINGEWSSPTPLILGHEGAGIVEEVGPGVTSVAVGDHVVLSWMPYCRRCEFCLSGRPNLCELTASTTYNSVMLDGTTRFSRTDEAQTKVFSYLATATFANRTVVPETAVIVIRKDAPLEKVALVGCAIATGIGAVTNTSAIQFGSTVLVVGCGGVGLACVAGAVAAGASRVIAADLSESNLARAKALGATDLVNSGEVDLIAEVKRLTRKGVDYAFEAIGLTSTIEAAYEALAPGGTAVVVGQVAEGKKISIDPFVMSDREKTLTGSNYGSCLPPRDFPRIVDLYMDGRLDLDQFIEKTVKLEEVNEAIKEMLRGGVARTVILHEH